MLSQIISCGGVCMKVTVGVILVLALTAVHNLGVQWQKEITDVSVHTIQDPRFWGPMTMLVPKNCTKLREMMHARGPAKSEFLEKEMQMGKPPTEIQTSLLGYVMLPDVDILQLTAVHRCNHKIDAPKVTWSQYYWSAMITASSNFDIDEMHKSRMRLFWLYVVLLAITYLSELCTSSIKTAQSLLTDVKDDGEPCALKALKFLLGQIFSKLGTLIQQLGFVSLFVTFWHEDHYLMNYFPGRAMVFAYVFLYIPQICIATRVVIGQSAGEKPADVAQDPIVIAANYCVSICSCLCCIPIVLPMLGWSFYNWQFLWCLFKGEYQSEIAFSASFPSLEDTVGQATKHLIGINVVDAVMGTLTEVAPAFAREPTPVSSDPNEPLLLD